MFVHSHATKDLNHVEILLIGHFAMSLVNGICWENWLYIVTVSFLFDKAVFPNTVERHKKTGIKRLNLQIVVYIQNFIRI